MTTDTSEKGLESLIVRAMTGRIDILSPPYVAAETSTPVAGGTGWILGDPKHYDRGACVDLVQLRGFLLATQPKRTSPLASAAPYSCGSAIGSPRKLARTACSRYAPGSTPASFALSSSEYRIAATSVPRTDREP